MDNKSGFTKLVLNYLKINHSSSYSGHFYKNATDHRNDKDNRCMKSYGALWGYSALAFAYDLLFKEIILLVIGKNYVRTP